MITTNYICECCRLQFIEEWDYNKHRSSSYNWNVTAHRWYSGKEGKPFFTDDYKEQLFISAIGMGYNSSSYETSKEIFNCCLIYMRRHGHNDIVEYLMSRMDDILKYHKEVLNKALASMEERHQKEKASLLKRIERLCR